VIAGRPSVWSLTPAPTSRRPGCGHQNRAEKESIASLAHRCRRQPSGTVRLECESSAWRTTGAKPLTLGPGRLLGHDQQPGLREVGRPPRESHELDRQAIHPRSTHESVLHLLCMSNYELQVKLGAKALAERDSHLMPISATTPEAFYELMAAAVLDAIDLPALLERVTRAERELEIIQQALRRADIEAATARHKAMTDGDASEDSSIASILRDSSMSGRPVRTQNPDPRPLSRDPGQTGAVDKWRRASVLRPPLERSESMRPQPPPAPPPRQPPSRTRRMRRGSRRVRANHFHSLLWPKWPLLRRPLRRATT